MMPRSTALIATTIVIAALASGCITPKQEKKLGDSQAKLVEAEMGIVPDPALTKYVKAVGEKLAAVSESPDDPWRFVVLDTEMPNAFALPGGHIYVTRGLLALLNSEDELACVLGHEIGHVTARHGAKRIGTAILMAPINLVTGIAGFTVALVVPSLGKAIGSTGQVLTGGLVIAPYGRAQENDADKIGQTLAALAGYDPAGMSSFLHTLDREVTYLTGDERRFHFLDTHPLTPSRVEKTKERIGTLVRAEPNPIAGGRRAFFGRLEGIVVGLDPAGGVFVENEHFVQPELDFAITFPSGWTTVNLRTAVGAIAPDENAVVAVEIVSTDKTLDEIQAQASAEDSEIRFERFEISGLPAARTELSARGVVVVVHLIEFKGLVYSVTGQVNRRQADSYRGAFGSTARSFRAAKRSEVAEIREARLRVREAQAQESPNAIARRAPSVWSGERLAIANGVGENDRFAAGEAVKVAISQAYERRGP
jgi:predicted Zn-dependent protease